MARRERRKFTDEMGGCTRDRAGAAGAQVEATAKGQPVCRNPDDEQILDFAVIGAADAHVTGDADLLRFGERGGVKVNDIADFEVPARAEKGSLLARYRPRLYAIPTKSIKHALVVIPTNSRRNHCF